MALRSIMMSACAITAITGGTYAGQRFEKFYNNPKKRKMKYPWDKKSRKHK